MSSIILAFIVGAFVGGGIMYMRYHKMAVDNLRELRLLQISGARLESQLEVLRIIHGMEGDIE